MKVLLALTIISIWVILMAIYVKYTLCHDLKKSVHSVLSFVKDLLKEIFKELFDNSDNNFFYPVRFGANIYGQINVEDVDDSFENLYKVFEPDGTYCDGVFEYIHVIQYGFAIDFGKEQVPDIKSLKKIIQKRLEKMLNQSFKEQGIFVSVKRYLDFTFDQENNPQYLYVWFAKTEEGSRLLQQQKKRRLLARRSIQNTHQDDFTADWEDDEFNENRH